jgi:hypothetical protein
MPLRSTNLRPFSVAMMRAGAVPASGLGGGGASPPCPFASACSADSSMAAASIANLNIQSPRDKVNRALSAEWAGMVVAES